MQVAEGLFLVSWKHGFTVGDGIDVNSGTVKQRPFVTVPSDADLQEEHLGILQQAKRIVTSSNDYSSLTEIDASVSGKGYGASASATYASVSEQTMSSREVNAVLAVRYQKHRRIMTGNQVSHLRLVPAATNMNIAAFEQQFGNGCIVGFIEGGHYMCNYKFRCVDSSKKDFVSAKISSSWEGYGVSVQGSAGFKRAVESATSFSQLSIIAVGSGVANQQYSLDSVGTIGQIICNFPQTATGTREFAIVRSYSSINACANLVGFTNVINYSEERRLQSKVEYLVRSATDLRTAWLFRDKYDRVGVLLQEITAIKHQFDTGNLPPGLQQLSTRVNQIREELESIRPIVPPRVTDHGYPNKFRGWFDAIGQGVRHDYGRFVGDGRIFWAVARCNSDNEYDEHLSMDALISRPPDAQLAVTDLGYPDRRRGWFDVTGSGKRHDYCRYVGPGHYGQIVFVPKLHTAPANEYPAPIAEASVFTRGGPAYANTVNIPPEFQ